MKDFILSCGWEVGKLRMTNKIARMEYLKQNGDWKLDGNYSNCWRQGKCSSEAV